jgi:hypothetical protein
LNPEITKAVTAVSDKQFVERRVFFPTFTRYFLAKERSFQIMIEELLRHREASHNNKLPLVLKKRCSAFEAHSEQKDGIPKGYVPSL